MEDGASSLYKGVAKVPLIKSPDLRVPKAVELPQDLHPLPDDVSAYFVYPFSLESYVLSSNTPSSSTIASLHERHASFLAAREAEKERRRKEALRRVAPGWAEGEGGAGVLEPTRRGQDVPASAGPGAVNEIGQERQRGVMDDLVDHLAAVDTRSTTLSGSLDEREG